MNHIQKIVDTHALKNFFCVSLIEHRAGKITMSLSIRDDISGGQYGALGCVVDCAARMAGYAAIGQCFLSECEINVHTQSRVQEFIVSANIAACQKHYATYHCEIYSADQLTNLLIAESQGTLQKNK